MKQNIINARVTFRKSPIHVLEKFAFKDMPKACLTFKKNSSVSECVIIQTCNRIELFATSDNHNVDEIKNTWASLTGLEDNAFRDTLEVCENRDAYEHLLKLTSGLESLVVGEEQILGQIKESISAARKVDASGKRLNKLFERSIRIGTRIRNSTGIGRGGISLGSMAVKLAEENIDDIKSKSLVSEILEFDLSESCRIFSHDHLGNMFSVFLFPHRWLFEMQEAWHDENKVGFGFDSEDARGIDHPPAIAGAYFAAKLGVAEYLVQKKLQAAVLVLREIRPEYAVPVGVWQIREAVRAAMKKEPYIAGNFIDGVNFASKRMSIGKSEWLSRGRLLKMLKQKSISEFF